MFEVYKHCPRCAAELIDREIADDGGARIRRACPADTCGFVQWQNPTPAVGALVEHDGEIILARGAGWPEGAFALVTGYLERNEDPKLGVAREVKEELNLDVVETNLIGNYIFERKNEIMLCYHVVATGTVSLSPELMDYRRYQPHELRPWPRATGFAVADWMRSRGYEVIYRDLPLRPAAPVATES